MSSSAAEKARSAASEPGLAKQPRPTTASHARSAFVTAAWYFAMACWHGVLVLPDGTVPACGFAGHGLTRLIAPGPTVVMLPGGSASSDFASSVRSSSAGGADRHPATNTATT